MMKITKILPHDSKPILDSPAPDADTEISPVLLLVLQISRNIFAILFIFYRSLVSSNTIIFPRLILVSRTSGSFEKFSLILLLMVLLFIKFSPT